MSSKTLSITLSAAAVIFSVSAAHAVIQRSCDKTFTEQARNRNGQIVYPERAQVPANMRPWSIPFAEYAPPYYRDPSVADNTAPLGQKWADPETKINTNGLSTAEFATYLATSTDASIPRNPCGRTGIVGQGLLGKWGENWAADPIVTRYIPSTGKLSVLLIKRADTGEWAIPGGMVDPGETKLSVTARRELKEETGLDVDMTAAKEIYVGLVDDPRNTDNSWMMTRAYHLHLDDATSLIIEKQLLKAEDAGEIKGIQWVPYDDTGLSKLFAAHTQFIAAVLKSNWKKQIAPFARTERENRMGEIKRTIPGHGSSSRSDKG